MQFPWHWEFFFCLFLQGSWSSFQLKKRNLLAGQGWLKAKWELNNPRKWSLSKKISLVCKISVSFTECLKLTTGAGISSIYISIQHIEPLFSSPFNSFFLFTSEDPCSFRSCCFCTCWAVPNPSNSSMSTKCEDLWICSFMES